MKLPMSPRPPYTTGQLHTKTRLYVTWFAGMLVLCLNIFGGRVIIL